ncbi:FHA domain-containing protein [Psychrobacter pygoscelis]|uniref:FHA domain-containing protein n=1 Tax=Psychrobacter pygoscelis TaxID=2488563 RepID=UPI00103EC343|nr:FHA domain-containing protein [Psychrobacter pygoscelis]
MGDPVDNEALQSENNTVQWQLNALTEALGDLTLTVEDSLSIGRGQDNDVVLGSKQISRNHALLSILNGKLYIKDLGSSNGTFINDEQIEPSKSKLLTTQDTVSFAAFSFEVVEVPLVASSQPVVQADPAEISSHSATDSDALRPVLEDEAVKPDEASISTKTTAAESALSEPVLTTESAVASEAQPVKADATASDSSLTKTPSKVADRSEDLESVLPPEISQNDNKGSVDEAPVVQQPVQPLQPSPEPEAKPEPNKPTEPATHKDNIETAPTTSNPPMEKTMPNKAPHDKTTDTELQQEADPEVLKAKQAASAQFSGTANLDQKPDVGTQGNNAVDQAATNPATHPDATKKSSGSWFIWLFIGLIILGIILWMFNMGNA